MKCCSTGSLLLSPNPTREVGAMCSQVCLGGCRCNKREGFIMELRLESTSLPRLTYYRPWAKGSRGSLTLLMLSVYLITILLIMLKSKHCFQCCATGCWLSCLFLMFTNLAWVGCYYTKMTKSSVDISISYVLLIMQSHDDSTSTIFTYPPLFVFHMPSHCCHCLIDSPVWCSQWDTSYSSELSWQ